MAKRISKQGKSINLPIHLASQLEKYGSEPNSIVEDFGRESHNASGVTPTVLEQVLLALISGHEVSLSKSESNNDRLNAAIKAITGKERFWTPWLDVDRKYIERMIAIAESRNSVTQLLQSAAKTSSKRKTDISLTSLAREAVAELDKKSVQKFNTADLARGTVVVEKFTGTYFRKQKKMKANSSTKGKFEGADYPGTWYHVARRHDYVEESLELQTVDRILKEFGKFDIKYKFVPPWE